MGPWLSEQSSLTYLHNTFLKHAQQHNHRSGACAVQICPRVQLCMCRPDTSLVQTVKGRLRCTCIINRICSRSTPPIWTIPQQRHSPPAAHLKICKHSVQSSEQFLDQLLGQTSQKMLMFPAHPFRRRLKMTTPAFHSPCTKTCMQKTSMGTPKVPAGILSHVSDHKASCLCGSRWGAEASPMGGC